MAYSHTTVQCWKDSGSAMEQFQRKTHKISPFYCALSKLCCYRMNKLTTSEFKRGQIDRETAKPNYTAPLLRMLTKGN